MMMKPKVSSKKTISKSNSLKTKSNSLKTNEKKKVVKAPGSFGNVLNNILKQEVDESKPILAKSSVIKEVTEQKEPSHIEKQKAKLDWEEMCRVKPDVLDREKERKLQRIATRGVVALFNAVKHQQKVVAESKKDKKSKVLITETKKSFISKLNSGTIEQEDDVTWNALRDDFMSNTTAKDWDKEDDDDNDDDDDDEME